MKRRKSSPPEETATEESTRDSVSMASSKLLLRPWMVSPAGRQRCTVRASPTPRGRPGQRGVPVPPGAQGRPAPTSVLLEEAQQRADGGHGRGHVGVVPQLRPEGLDQVCKATGRVRPGPAQPGAAPRRPPPLPLPSVLMAAAARLPARRRRRPARLARARVPPPAWMTYLGAAASSAGAGRSRCLRPAR